ncbi:hypothetical protein PVAP13_9KG405031 [Panicum virgatum]|uniref:Cytochrome b-c1 complex subunit 7 n=1 Tax=Panicum virgatum TaxID=38727 RepID=A0A8T0N5K7_PANVG|nr:hypothetical protein PVAP13_9KG405031 [Panicum virgatum]
MSSMMSVLSNWLVNPRRNPLARLHMHAVSSRLRKYGLRYDDLYDPYFDLDLSMKHQYLPEDLQAAQTPFRGYLSDMLALVKKESAEREALGALPLYQRTIP